MTIYVLHNGRIFDGNHTEPMEDGWVAVENDQIREIGTGSANVGGAVYLNCAGMTIMPGLIDAHVHVCLASSDFDAVDRMPKSLLAHHAGKALRETLFRGFTTVRDACGADHGLVMALEQGLILGPRLLISGKGISQTGGHGDGRANSRESHCGYVGALTVLADGPGEVRKAAREQLRAGARQLKIFASGGVTSPTDPIWMRQFTRAEILAAVEEAATRRTYVMAHCHTSAAARACIEAGVRTIEHGSDIDAPTAQLAAEAGAFVVPTLAIMDVAREYGGALGLKGENLRKLEGLLEKSFASIETCERHHTKLGFGTDLPGNFGYHQNREFQLRAQVQTAANVLRSATSVNAEIVQMSGEIGCIAPGARADLLVVSGNPLDDIEVLTRPEETLHLIMTGGTIVRNMLTSTTQ